MKAESIEKVIVYLNKLGIKTGYEDKKGELNRIIEIEVEGTKYWIEWWVNQSYLKLQNNYNSPCVPFKYINMNTYSPTTEHHDHLVFYDVKEPNKAQFLYHEIPFGALRIPFNLPK